MASSIYRVPSPAKIVRDLFPTYGKALPDIYNEAAMIVGESYPDNPEQYMPNHYYACFAIDKAGALRGNDILPAHLAKALFAVYFKPTHASAQDAWFGETSAPMYSNNPIHIHANREARILALLFMAEISKDLC